LPRHHEPEDEILLDEVDKHFTAQDRRFDNLKGQIAANAEAFASWIQALEKAVQVFDEWRPNVEG